MRLPKVSLILITFILVSTIYGYGIVNDLLLLKLVTKPLITITIAVYYVMSIKAVNKLFLGALFFALCGDMLFFNHNELGFVSAMGCFLLFILINMIIITDKIGQIKSGTFYLTILPFLLILITVLTLFFSEIGFMKLLFLVYGIVLGLYGSFSLYFYIKKTGKPSLLNLIGVLFFALAVIAKALKETTDPEIIYKIMNITFYASSLFFICQGYIEYEKIAMRKTSKPPNQEKSAIV